MLIKPQAGFLSPQAATSDVLVAELPSEPLEGLEALLAEVYIPLLANPANQEGWGEVAARDVMDRLHALLAQVTIAVGATRNETVLPLPPLAAAAALSPPPSSGTGHASCVGHEHGGGYAHGAGAGSSAGIGTSAGTVGVPGCSDMLRSQACTKSRIRQLEGSVLVWTRQLKAVLRQASDSALRAGAHPGPDAELSFWRDKAATLNAIFQQLQSDRIRRVLQFLDASESNFCTVSAGALGEADGAAANGETATEDESAIIVAYGDCNPAAVKPQSPTPSRLHAPRHAALCALVQGRLRRAARGKRQCQVFAATGALRHAAYEWQRGL